MAVKYSGTYSFGDTITIADACLVPQLYNARRWSLLHEFNRFNCDLTLFPTLVAIDERLSREDALKSAHPDQQPDCPEVAAKASSKPKDEEKK